MRQIQGKGRDKEHLAVFWGTNTHGLARRLCLRNPWLPCFTPVQYYDGIWHRDRARLHKSTHVSVRVYPRMCLKTAAFEGPSNGDTVLLCQTNGLPVLLEPSWAQLLMKWSQHAVKADTQLPPVTVAPQTSLPLTPAPICGKIRHPFGCNRHNSPWKKDQIAGLIPFFLATV